MASAPDSAEGGSLTIVIIVHLLRFRGVSAGGLARVVRTASVPILDEPLTDVSVPLVWAQHADGTASAKPSAIATTLMCFITPARCFASATLQMR